MKKTIPLLFSLLLAPNHSALALPKPNVAVFCSADDKATEKFKILAHDLGIQLAKNNFGLVTGGSRTGLMKEVVDGYAQTQQNLSNLHGILPLVFAKFNLHHPSIPQENLKWTDTVHNRLSEFHKITDTIVVLPGGYGTLHELMDFLVHNQFGIHKTQVILINIDGFWNHLIELFKVMADQQLVPQKHLDMLMIVESAQDCIKSIQAIHEVQDLSSHYWEQNK